MAKEISSDLESRLIEYIFYGFHLFVYFNSKTTSASSSDQKKRVTIVIPLIKAFGWTFLVGSILELAEVLLAFVSPQLLREIVKFVSSRGIENAGQSTDSQDIAYTPEWHGILYAVLLFVMASIRTLCTAQSNKYLILIGLRIKTALVGVIYQKSLCLSNTARKAKTIGEIVNLMAVDTMRLKELITYVNMIWTSPLQIFLAIYFLWDLLGVAVLAGKLMKNPIKIFRFLLISLFCYT